MCNPEDEPLQDGTEVTATSLMKCLHAGHDVVSHLAALQSTLRLLQQASGSSFSSGGPGHDLREQLEHELSMPRRLVSLIGSLDALQNELKCAGDRLATSTTVDAPIADEPGDSLHLRLLNLGTDIARRLLRVGETGSAHSADENRSPWNGLGTLVKSSPTDPSEWLRSQVAQIQASGLLDRDDATSLGRRRNRRWAMAWALLVDDIKSRLGRIHRASVDRALEYEVKTAIQALPSHSAPVTTLDGPASDPCEPTPSPRLVHSRDTLAPSDDARRPTGPVSEKEWNNLTAMEQAIARQLRPDKPYSVSGLRQLIKAPETSSHPRACVKALEMAGIAVRDNERKNGTFILGRVLPDPDLSSPGHTSGAD